VIHTAGFIGFLPKGESEKKAKKALIQLKSRYLEKGVEKGFVKNNVEKRCYTKLQNVYMNKALI
jgi:hypothetical protein